MLRSLPAPGTPPAAPTPSAVQSSSGGGLKRPAIRPTNGKRGGQPRNLNARTHGMYSALHPSTLASISARLSLFAFLAHSRPQPETEAILRQVVGPIENLSSADLLLAALRALNAALHGIFQRAFAEQDHTLSLASMALSLRVVGMIHHIQAPGMLARGELEKVALASSFLPIWQFTGVYGISRDADEDYSNDGERHSFPVAPQKSGQKLAEPTPALRALSEVEGSASEGSRRHRPLLAQGGFQPPPRTPLPRGSGATTHEGPESAQPRLAPSPLQSNEAPATIAISPEIARLWWMDAHREPEFEPLDLHSLGEPAKVTYYVDAPDEYGWFTDPQWQRIAHLLPGRDGIKPPSPTPRQAAAGQPLSSSRGRPPASARAVLSGIFWKLSHAASWNDLPNRFPSKRTCRRYYKRWFLSGRLMTIYKVLMRDLLTRGRIQPRDFSEEGYFCIDLDRRIRTTTACPDTWQTRTALLFMQQSYALIRRIRREQKDPYFPPPLLHGKLRAHYMHVCLSTQKGNPGAPTSQ